MKISWLRNIFGFKSATEKPAADTNVRQRLSFDALPAVIYAIGDVHGRLDLLLDLEAQIAADCVAGSEPATIIMLGDYVDRGPSSAGVIDHLIAPPTFNANRLCLLGNHEFVMLDFMKAPQQTQSWLELGGRQTLQSYGLSEDETELSALEQPGYAGRVSKAIPRAHVDFLCELPILVQFPKLLFVHAGVRSHVPMEAQTDRDLIWIRKQLPHDLDEFGFLVVHGHTPSDEPFISDYLINVDTGACWTGRLSAAKFTNGQFDKILATAGDPT